jgi:hypothetical protein
MGNYLYGHTLEEMKKKSAFDLYVYKDELANISYCKAYPLKIMKSPSRTLILNHFPSKALWIRPSLPGRLIRLKSSYGHLRAMTIQPKNSANGTFFPRCSLDAPPAFMNSN